MVTSTEQLKEQLARSFPEDRDASFYYRVFNYGQNGASLRGKRVLDIGLRDSNFIDQLQGFADVAIGLDPDYRNRNYPPSLRSKMMGVAQHLPFTNAVFDETTASFVLISMEPEEIVDVLSEMLRTTKSFGHVKIYPVFPVRGVTPSLPPYMRLGDYSEDPGDTWHTLDMTNVHLEPAVLEADLNRVVRKINFNPSIYRYLPKRDRPRRLIQPF